MKKLITIIIFGLLTINLLISQSRFDYTTPGSGSEYTLMDIALISNGCLDFQNNKFILNGELTIAGNDKLLISDNAEMLCVSKARIIIENHIEINPPDYFIMTALDTINADSCFIGIYLKDNQNNPIISKMTMKFGCGLKIVDSYDVAVNSCTFYKNKYSSKQGGAAIVCDGSNVVIDSCNFRENNRSAISSPANGSGNVQIRNSTFYWNNEKNGNYPQINMGPGNYTITGNYVEGHYDRAGGISVASLIGGTVNATITNNHVINNRYGIAGTGNNINMIVIENTIVNNNLETNPMNGGSGINLYSTDETSYLFAQKNYITGNLWGITLVGSAKGNIGCIDDNDEIYNEGFNVIFDNGNNGAEYNLYNNTPNNVFAQNNYWGYETLDESNTVVFDFDEDSTLGHVFLDPIFLYTYCEKISNLVADVDMDKVILNWTNPEISDFDSLKIYRDSEHIATVSGVNYIDENVQAGNHIYGVSVKYLYHECEESDTTSVEVDVILQDTTCNPVSDLTASVDGNKVTLNWTNPELSDQDSIYIYRDYFHIATITGNSFIDYNLAPGDYHYAVSIKYYDHVCNESEPVPVEVVVLPDGISDYENGLIIYPNPSNKDVYIVSEENINNISIYNMIGEKVYENTLNDNIHFIDVTKFKSGVYIIITQFDNIQIKRKLVIN